MYFDLLVLCFNYFAPLSLVGQGQSADARLIAANRAMLVFDFAEAEKQLKIHLEILIRSRGSEIELGAAYNQLGACQLLQGSYVAAERSLRRSLDIRRKRVSVAPEDCFMTLNNLAQVYLFQGKYRDAELCCLEAYQAINKQSIEMGEMHADIFLLLARVYNSCGYHADAELCIQKSISLYIASDYSPLSPVYKTYVDILISRKLYDKALVVLRTKCRSIAWERDPWHLAHARCLLGNGDICEATREFEALLTSDSAKRSKAFRADILTHLAISQSLSQKHRDARSRLQEAIDLYIESLSLTHPSVAATIKIRIQHFPFEYLTDIFRLIPILLVNLAEAPHGRSWFIERTRGN